MTGLYSYPDRRTILVRIPRDLLDAADHVAADRGVDRAIVLGDLVASELPDALAEAARALLGDEREDAALVRPELSDRGARSP